MHKLSIILELYYVGPFIILFILLLFFFGIISFPVFYIPCFIFENGANAQLAKSVV